ncbi:nucleotide exchange factor GrpE [Roseitranquillus sediminis]|uniref:nucleotide exchange factor GrpE n=1 Tax=Roseitranquillus sediminis TaxID=2809051 RepID=UPI001D0CA60F|nr:nucleotide exchange factor GrpE [Roseitranquillus sediminis]MBM9593803.1 nucleotide exchange factor GrpE [Roseitranquillus sediminis]
MNDAKKKTEDIELDERAETPEAGSAAEPTLEEAAFDEAPALDELEHLRSERDAYRDRFMRALADAENARKRGERDRREAEQYGGSKLARDMLPVHDNLRRAVEAVTEDQRAASAALIEGIELTMRELLNVFRKHGIEPIEPQAGERFDPQRHQAMFEAPVPDTRAGDIIQVMSTGFMLHDRLLRPAQVGVSSTPSGSSSSK